MYTNHVAKSLFYVDNESKVKSSAPGETFIKVISYDMCTDVYKIVNMSNMYTASYIASWLYK